MPCIQLFCFFDLDMNKIIWNIIQPFSVLSVRFSSYFIECPSAQVVLCFLLIRFRLYDFDRHHISDHCALLTASYQERCTCQSSRPWTTRGEALLQGTRRSCQVILWHLSWEFECLRSSITFTTWLSNIRSHQPTSCICQFSKNILKCHTHSQVTPLLTSYKRSVRSVQGKYFVFLCCQVYQCSLYY